MTPTERVRKAKRMVIAEVIRRYERLETPIELKCESKFRKWAYDNAYQNITIVIFFVLTWIYIGVIHFVE